MLNESLINRLRNFLDISVSLDKKTRILLETLYRGMGYDVRLITFRQNLIFAELDGCNEKNFSISSLNGIIETIAPQYSLTIDIDPAYEHETPRAHTHFIVRIQKAAGT